MKNFLLILILFSFILSGCSVKDQCNNRFDFISTNDSIPILNLDFSSSPDSSIFEKLNIYYGFDLCEKCSWVEFKTPFEIEGKQGYLKLLADFDYEYCSICPLPIRERHYFKILINLNNQILAEGNFLVQIDSLKLEILNYLDKVGNDDNFPSSFKKVNYFIQWDINSDPKFVNEVFTTIYSAHLEFVESKLFAEGIDFCSLNKKEIRLLKEKYPLRIEIHNGKSMIIASPEEMMEFQKQIEEYSDDNKEEKEIPENQQN